MFTLIIIIIAVGLAVALVAAAIYYGGSIWTQARARAEAAALVAQAQQIALANRAYAPDHAGAYSLDVGPAGAGITALVSGGYLAAVPQVPSSLGNSGWTLPQGMSPVDTPSVTINSELVCEEVVAELAGTTTLTQITAGENEAGCFDPGNGTYSVYYPDWPSMQ